jgi:hypothetical protein
MVNEETDTIVQEDILFLGQTQGQPSLQALRPAIKVLGALSDHGLQLKDNSCSSIKDPTPCVI